MKYPSLFQTGEDGRAHLSEEFVNMNENTEFSPERGIEKLRQLAYDKLYKQKVEAGKMSSKDAKQKLQVLNDAYALAKHKFQRVMRNTGERYFDHLYYVLEKSLDGKNPKLKKSLIALLHDIVEDTDISFESLESTFGTEVALGVYLISKKSVKYFIDQEVSLQKANKNDHEENNRTLRSDLAELIINTGVGMPSLTEFNPDFIEKKYGRKEPLSDEEVRAERIFLQYLTPSQKYALVKKTKILNKKGTFKDEHLVRSNSSEKKKTLSAQELFGHALYKTLESQYKNQIAEEFFSHMLPVKNHYILRIENTEYLYKFFRENEFPTEKKFISYPCIENMYQHAGKVLDEKDSYIIPENLIKVVLYAIEVKLLDRIHNLLTAEVYGKLSEKNIDKSRRKIKETQKYFLQIAVEFDMLTGSSYFKHIDLHIQAIQKYIESRGNIDIRNDIEELFQDEKELKGENLSEVTVSQIKKNISDRLEKLFN